ncbi:MAG TPA: BatA and WFA domain-containing protein [Steroidobacteraceae bacterium]|nr:BatA and WFA domain-containing protein [Steroidobacteraceae bacterium]
MTLLAPLFLAGLAAIALPLWLHLRREPRRSARPFSSAMLLRGAPQPLRVRRRWRERLLLALRVLLLAALCLAFAQPLWPRRAASAAGGAALQLIVLDTSLSMGASGRFARAREVASRLIEGLTPGQRAQLLSAGDGLAVLASAGTASTADRAALQAALAQVRPGSARLDFGAAMAGLDSVLAGQRGDVDVHFISDLQATGLPTRFADLLPPAASGRSIRVLLHPVAPDAAQANWAVTAVRRIGADVDVTVRGFGTAPRTLTVALQVNGREIGRVQQALAADGEAHFSFAHPLLAVGDNRVRARLIDDAGLAGDALAADDERVAVIRNAPPDAVPLLTAQPNGRAVSYLSTALAATGAGYAADVQGLQHFDARTLPRYRWVIVDDLGALDARLAGQLADYVRQGGALFAALGEMSASRDRLPLLGDAPHGSAGSDASALQVGAIDASSPLLAGLSGWDALSIEHLPRLRAQSGDRELVAMSDGTPLLLLRPMGRGRVLLYTGDLADAGNDLPVQPLFVGLMTQIARSLSGRGEVPGALPVDASLSLSELGASAGQLIDPAGHTVLSLGQTRRAPTVKLTQSGFYQLYTAATEALIGVNPEPLESDLAPISASTLARWRTALAADQTAEAHGAGMPATARELLTTHVPLAPLLLALLCATVIAESLLGNRALREPVPPSAPPPVPP